MNRNKNNQNTFAKRRPVQMLLILTLLAYPLLQGLTNFAASAARTMHTPNKAEYAMANTSSVGQTYQPGDIKVLAEGFHSKITKPFVAVVRDAETYQALSKLDGNLPKLDSDYFNSHVVVAAFLGERNTGGYGIEIAQSAVGIRILEEKPGKGMMVPQMITSPFKVVALESAYNAPVWLALGDAWKKSMPFYRITSGRFVMTGGFAGTSEQFGLHGSVGVIREGNIATFQFRIVGSEEMKKEHAMTEYATGIVESDGHVAINKMSAGSLVNAPNSGLKATGVFSRKDNKLLLNLVSLPMMIADGYSGHGNIEAEMEAPLIKDKPVY